MSLLPILFGVVVVGGAAMLTWLHAYSDEDVPAPADFLYSVSVVAFLMVLALLWQRSIVPA